MTEEVRLVHAAEGGDPVVARAAHVLANNGAPAPGLQAVQRLHAHSYTIFSSSPPEHYHRGMKVKFEGFPVGPVGPLAVF